MFTHYEFNNFMGKGPGGPAGFFSGPYSLTKTRFTRSLTLVSSS